jgi:HK97 gp10 family phage protein
MKPSLSWRVKANRVSAVSDEVRRELGHSVERAALNVVGRAKVLAPVDTGYLRNSIEQQKTGDLEHTVSVGAEYGAYVNFGTRHMAARPFLTQAVEDERPHFIADVASIEAKVRR